MLELPTAQRRHPFVTATLDSPGSQSGDPLCKLSMPETWYSQAAFVLACLGIPMLWGWIVNWLFNRWKHHRAAGRKRDESFIEYQI